MGDDRYLRMYDLKQKVQYHPEVGTYVSEEDIDFMERRIISEPDNKPCKHCQPPFKHFGKYYIKTGYPQDTSLYVLRRDGNLGGVMIEYCPMCGRKLDQPIEGYILEE